MIVTGSLPRDKNAIAIQANNGISAIDASGTPKKSPLTVSNSVLTLTPPTNAIGIVFYSTTNDCRISDEATATDHYFVLKAATAPLILGCSSQNVFYLLRDAGADVVLQFMFLTL